MKHTPIAVMALVLLGACGGNKNNTGNPSTTTDTSAGAMSPSASPNQTNPPPSTNPSTTNPSNPSAAPATPAPDTMGAMSHDTNMKKMSGRRGHKKADTTTH
jgi:hypothetical protein